MKRRRLPYTHFCSISESPSSNLDKLYNIAKIDISDISNISAFCIVQSENMVKYIDYVIKDIDNEDSFDAMIYRKNRMCEIENLLCTQCSYVEQIDRGRSFMQKDMSLLLEDYMTDDILLTIEKLDESASLLLEMYYNVLVDMVKKIENCDLCTLCDRSKFYVVFNHIYDTYWHTTWTEDCKEINRRIRNLCKEKKTDMLQKIRTSAVESLEKSVFYDLYNQACDLTSEKCDYNMFVYQLYRYIVRDNVGFFKSSISNDILFKLFWAILHIEYADSMLKNNTIPEYHPLIEITQNEREDGLCDIFKILLNNIGDCIKPPYTQEAINSVVCPLLDSKNNSILGIELRDFLQYKTENTMIGDLCINHFLRLMYLFVESNILIKNGLTSAAFIEKTLGSYWDSSWKDTFNTCLSKRWDNDMGKKYPHIQSELITKIKNSVNK